MEATALCAYAQKRCIKRQDMLISSYQHAWTKQSLRILVFALFGCYPCLTAAKDLATLAEAVIPAYTAMNFGLLCTQYDPQFLAQTTGPRGSAVKYAEHIKDEAIASLTYVEATSVLKTAADAARQIARSKLSELTVPGDDSATNQATSLWCDIHGKSFVTGVIERHDSDHTSLLESLRRAQQ